MVFKMEIINHNIFINKISESKKKGYDIVEIKRISWLVNFSDESILIEDEENFLNVFSDLLYYFDIVAQNDNLFKQIIDDLLEISQKKNLNYLDIKYILNKNEILKIIDKFKLKKISKSILIKQLKKYFNVAEFNEIQEYLNNQNIEIQII